VIPGSRQQPATRVGDVNDPRKYVQRFGFTAVGVRKGYYADSGEDALIMWAHDADQPDYAALLDRLERGVPGTTVFERPRIW